MEAVVIVTVLALVQYMFFSVLVGGARPKYKVTAPAMSGDQQFERVNRVHQNTLEQLIIFVPALWMYGFYVNPLWGAGLGIVYIIGRFIYRAAYLQDPKNRTLGFVTSYLPSVIMLIWVLIVAIWSYF